MYYEHFGLKEPPFKITPNTEVFFTGGNRGAVLDAITYAILNGEGIVKVVGEVGSGKTMLCRMLQTMLPDRVESIYLANPSVAPEDVLHAIAIELKVRLPKNVERLKVMQSLQTHLLKRHAAGKQVVIFIEEAQGMPLATLEEIRLLSNLETNYDKLLQIVMFGQPELDENLNEVSIRQLRERITHSFNLMPFEPTEIGEYINFRLRASGYVGPPIFTKAAIKKLANAAQGLVRRVNILADKSLLAAFSENGYQVTPKHVQAAIADSEFGKERAKVKGGAYKLLLLLAVLAALALGFLASNWYQSHWAKEKSVFSGGAASLNEQQGEIEQEAVTTAPMETEKQTEQSMASIETEIENASPGAGVAQQSAVSDSEDDLLSRRLRITEEWLDTQPTSTVSIQIMGGSESPQLKADLELLSQKVELDNLYVYRTQVKGQPFLNVLYGSFFDRQTAFKALRQLPTEIKRNKPQLRTIAGVLQETKQLP